jgi:UvrD-like helicase C-terminal domain
MRVVERARAFQAAGGGGLRSFTQWLGERLDGGDRNETEAVTLEEGDQAVRIMTIHGAKGLEFPIAVLANLNTKPDTRRETISRPELHELHFQAGNKDSGFATPGYDEQRQHEKQMFDGEEQRLLYVALTRAKDHLVIPFVPPRGECTGMLALLESQLPDHEDDIVGADVCGVHVFDTSLFEDAGAPEPARAPKAGRREIDAAEAALNAWARERTEALAPPTGALLIGAKGGRLNLNGARAAFRTLVNDCRLPVAPGCRAPRLHDARHSFAVNTLIDAHRQGANVDARIATLANYLGHVDPTHTYWYLTASPQLMQTVRERMAAWQETMR